VVVRVRVKVTGIVSALDLWIVEPYLYVLMRARLPSYHSR
jgi:hypothetical protein